MNYGGDRYTAKEIIIHPNYHNIILANDLALVILGEDIELSPTVAIIPLFQSEGVEDDTELKVTGWGTDEVRKSQSIFILMTHARYLCMYNIFLCLQCSYRYLHSYMITKRLDPSMGYSLLQKYSLIPQVPRPSHNFPLYFIHLP